MRNARLKPAVSLPLPQLPTEPPEEPLLTDEQRAQVEAALPQLAFTRALIARMERVSIPCEEAKSVCEQLVAFFTGLAGITELPEHTGPLPSPFAEESYAQLEEAMREIAVAQRIMARCEKCGIPVSQAQGAAQAIADWLNGVVGEFRGPGAPIGGAPFVPEV